MNIKVAKAASLIPTNIKKQPVSSSYITSDMIADSGARNLMELLEIFVPSYQWQAFSTSGGIDGFRGLVTRRKYLILVNGKVMTAPRISTNFAERELSLMGDIESIEVIRGPGSALLGPGAISGVINIKTYTPTTFGERVDVNVKKGFVEDFESLEFRIGHIFQDDVKMFLYGGIENYDGADADDAPYFSIRSYPDSGIFADEEVSGADKYKSAYQDDPRYKLHLEFEIGNFTTWLRYTRSGMIGVNNSSTLALLGGPERHETGSQQLSWVGEYVMEINEDLNAKFSANFTLDDFALKLPSFTSPEREFLRSSRMDWYQGKAEIFWYPHEQHSFALGLEYTKYVLGLESELADEDPTISGFVPADRWHSHNAALYGEYQYSPTADLTLFLGGRLDKHEDADLMFSPKIGITYLVSENDTLKVLYNRSLRRPAESEIRRIVDNNETVEPETLDSFEVIYDKQLNKHHTLTTSLFYYSSDLENLGTDFRSEEVGQLETLGLELEWKYKSEDWLILASYTYTDLLNLKLNDPTDSNRISPEPYGGADDFLDWATHQFKIYSRYNFNEKFSINSSLVATWGFDGAESAAGSDFPLTIPTDDGNDAFKENIYLNFGAAYKFNDNLTIRGQALNILGWIDESYNKRNNHGFDSYRHEAEAFIISLEYKF